MAEKEFKKTGRPEGGDIASGVKLNANKKIKLNPDFVMPRINLKEIDPKKTYRCFMCGTGYDVQRNNFPSGGGSILWKGNNGFLPFCKKCCEALMDALTDFYSGNEEHALRHLCGLFDWYYSDLASAMALAQVQLGKSRVSLYPSKLGTRQVATRGTSFLDTIKEENAGSEVITSVEDIDDFNDDDDFVVTKEIIRTWGKGYTKDQYQYLQEEYDDWCAKNVCNTKTQQEIYKNIAIAQLNIRIAQQNGGKVAEAMDALQKLMNSANILPKQTAENLLADTQTFGTLLKKFEETSPVPEPAPEWKDVDGIRKYMNTWFRGGLGKALKIKNDNTALYEEALEEMDRYTVRREQDGDSADGMGNAIFDHNGSGGGVDEPN